MDESKAKGNLKKLKKRLELVRENEVTVELTRLGLKSCPNEEAVVYRN